MPTKRQSLVVVDLKTGEGYTVIADLSDYDLDNNPMDRETVAMAVADMVAVTKGDSTQ